MISNQPFILLNLFENICKFVSIFPEWSQWLYFVLSFLCWCRARVCWNSPAAMEMLSERNWIERWSIAKKETMTQQRSSLKILLKWGRKCFGLSWSHLETQNARREKPTTLQWASETVSKVKSVKVRLRWTVGSAPSLTIESGELTRILHSTSE